jgi:asparagine synthase (glutamine-hydrolysing)
MCGFVAVYSKDASEPVDAQILTRMTDTLAHRGPDDRGVLVDGEAGIGHRRLSVIDLDGGHQPMQGPSGRTWIAFNGEVFNYRELREELISEGVRLRTKSDTEVVLALYEREGAAGTERLNGMFAFAIWDQRTRQLVIVRDRVGVKPIYIWDGPRHVVVASEIKAILEFPGVPREVRRDALEEWLVFRNLSGYRTLFKDIDAMQPGTVRVLGREGATTRQYWSIPDRQSGPTTFDRAAARLEELLFDSVRLRMVADVPLGAFNSGGLDSSLVTAMAAKLKGEPLRTFSVGFREKDWDETPYARTLSRHVGSVHEELFADPKVFADELSKSIWHLDQPVTHPNSVLIRLLAEFAKQKVTVVLTGEGADELFGGYPRYRLPLVLDKLRPASLPLERLARPFVGRFGSRKARLTAAVLGRPLEYALATNAAYALGSDLGGLLRPEVIERRLAMIPKGGDVLRRLLILEVQTYLHGVLERMDKMTMAYGLEARVPFLDFRIIEFAASLPASIKMRGFRTKALVKSVARRWIPNEIIDRPKSGFGVPLGSWFRDSESLGRFANGAESEAARGADAIGLPLHSSDQNDDPEQTWSSVALGLWLKDFRLATPPPMSSR